MFAYMFMLNIMFTLKRAFFKESFNLWRPLMIITFYYQIKTSISF